MVIGNAKFTLLGMLFLTGCGSSEAPRLAQNEKPVQGAEDKSADLSEADEDAPDSDSDGDQVDLDEAIEGDLIKAQYKLKISVGFLTMAEGELDLLVTKDLGKETGQPFEIPRGCIEVADANLDLKKAMTEFGGGELFGSADGGDPAEPELKNDVIALPGIGAVKYSPARPLLPSFLAVDAEDLARLDVSRNVRLENTKTGETGTGEFRLQTTEFDAAYKSPAGTVTFPKTMRFKNTTTGFDAITDKLGNSLFEEMEMVVALDPIAIAYLGITSAVPEGQLDVSKISDLDVDSLGSDECGPTGGGMLKFLQTLAGSGLLDGLLSAGGGDEGGDGGLIGSVAGVLKDTILKSLKIKIELQLIDQEGLDEWFEDE